MVCVRNSCALYVSLEFKRNLSNSRNGALEFAVKLQSDTWKLLLHLFEESMTCQIQVMTDDCGEGVGN